MKINPYQVNKALGVYNTQKTSGTKKAGKYHQGSDKVSISDSGQIFQMVLKAAKGSPDVRTEKVEEIKAKIASGKYQVASSDIADKIIEQALLSKRFR